MALTACTRLGQCTCLGGKCLRSAEIKGSTVQIREYSGDLGEYSIETDVSWALEDGDSLGSERTAECCLERAQQATTSGIVVFGRTGAGRAAVFGGSGESGLLTPLCHRILQSAASISMSIVDVTIYGVHEVLSRQELTDWRNLPSRLLLQSEDVHEVVVQAHQELGKHSSKSRCGTLTHLEVSAERDKKTFCLTILDTTGCHDLASHPSALVKDLLEDKIQNSLDCLIACVSPCQHDTKQTIDLLRLLEAAKDRPQGILNQLLEQHGDDDDDSQSVDGDKDTTPPTAPASPSQVLAEGEEGAPAAETSERMAPAQEQESVHVLTATAPAPSQELSSQPPTDESSCGFVIVGDLPEEAFTIGEVELAVALHIIASGPLSNEVVAVVPLPWLISEISATTCDVPCGHTTLPLASPRDQLLQCLALACSHCAVESVHKPPTFWRTAADDVLSRLVDLRCLAEVGQGETQGSLLQLIVDPCTSGSFDWFFLGAARSPKRALVVMESLLRQLACCLVAGDGGHHSATYPLFQRATLELAHADISQLNTLDLKVFFVNLFNTMLLHSYLEAKLPDGADAKEFLATAFGEARYQVGNRDYTLEDIFVLVTGAPSCHASLLPSRFFPSSLSWLCMDTLPLCGPTGDPRFHFVLCEGTRSGPPFTVLTIDKVNAQLNAAVRHSLSKMRITLDPPRLKLPSVFKHYRRDFGGTRGVMTFVSRHCDDETNERLGRCADTPGFKITYGQHHWTKSVGRLVREWHSFPS